MAKPRGADGGEHHHHKVPGDAGGVGRGGFFWSEPRGAVVVKTVLGSPFGWSVNSPPILEPVLGDWDVHWGCDLDFEPWPRVLSGFSDRWIFGLPAPCFGRTGAEKSVPAMSTR